MRLTKENITQVADMQHEITTFLHTSPEYTIKEYAWIVRQTANILHILINCENDIPEKAIKDLEALHKMALGKVREAGEEFDCTKL